MPVPPATCCWWTVRGARTSTSAASRPTPATGASASTHLEVSHASAPVGSWWDQVRFYHLYFSPHLFPENFPMVIHPNFTPYNENNTFPPIQWEYLSSIWLVVSLPYGFDCSHFMPFGEVCACVCVLSRWVSGRWVWPVNLPKKVGGIQESAREQICPGAGFAFKSLITGAINFRFFNMKWFEKHLGHPVRTISEKYLKIASYKIIKI